MTGLFTLAARHGRLLLVAGLIVGVAAPSLALAMKPWLGVLVTLLLFLAALRIGPRGAIGAGRDLPATALLVMVFQLALPLAAIALFSLVGSLGTLTTSALVLMLSASAISGSPNLTILLDHDPAPALRLLIVGTGLLPLTVVPVFWLLPELGTPGDVAIAAGRLLAVIGFAAGLAFAIRATVLRQPSQDVLNALDGMSAIAMAVVVVGLMSAVGPALTGAPADLLYWLAVVFAANFGLQIVTTLVMRRTPLAADAAPVAVTAGNRNIALFLVALPASVTDPLLLFIGCYQIPMYLTPLMLHRFYGAAVPRSSR